ncbi:MAG: hypothetical protein EGR04_00955, partial [Blautia sp.]|nr:hypothetical protein [Blautia sp.]
ENAGDERHGAALLRRLQFLSVKHVVELLQKHFKLHREISRMDVLVNEIHAAASEKFIDGLVDVKPHPVNAGNGVQRQDVEESIDHLLGQRHGLHAAQVAFDKLAQVFLHFFKRQLIVGLLF